MVPVLSFRLHRSPLGSLHDFLSFDRLRRLNNLVWLKLLLEVFLSLRLFGLLLGRLLLLLLLFLDGADVGRGDVRALLNSTG